MYLAFFWYWLLLWLRQLRICLQCRRPAFSPWVRKIPCRKEWLPTPVLLLGESHGQRSLAGYSPWGHKESDMTEWQTQPFGIICSQRFSSEPCFLYHFIKPHTNIYWNSASSRGKQQKKKMKRDKEWREEGKENKEGNIKLLRGKSQSNLEGRY